MADKNDKKVVDASVAVPFEALADFVWKRDGMSDCHYTKGLGYTVRVGNTALASMVNQWVIEGKVKLTFDDRGIVSTPAKVGGVGKVT